MALTAAELVAYLRLDKSDYEKGMTDAEQRMGKSQGKFRDWAGGMGKAAAEVAVGGATAVAGLATAVFTTGLNYNTLQQSSRAAMETLMGGAEEANKQMDKLDAFAANSPFAKQIFIQAQQQLVGFGMAAEDVIPTLSAIEDSVAAVGGSNEDIAGIVTVLAQVEGTGKFTGETLMRLGQRGIDAASIIGEEMGKSGATIREEITAGTLDADDAMKALTTGMTERFGGAAANVKETAVGAADRISAAFRDIGSHMAEPFIDPRGGGYVIEWANDFADILRAVQGHVPDFVDMMMNRFGPAFDNVSISMKDARDAIKDFDVTDLNVMLDKTAAYAPAIAGVSGALFALGTTNVPVIGRLSQALGPIPAALGAAALASPDMRDALGQVGDALKPLVPMLADLAEIAAGVFTTGFEVAADILGVAADIVGPLVEGFSQLPTPIQNTVGALAAFTAVRKLMPDFSKKMGQGFGSITTGVKETLDGLNPWGSRFEGAAGEALTFGRRLDIIAAEQIGIGGKTGGFRGALNGVVSFLGGPWGIALTVATVALGAWAKSQQEAKADADEFIATLDDQTGAFTDASEALLADRIVEKVQDSGDSVRGFAGELETYGLTVGDISSAILEQGDAHDYLKDKIIEANKGAKGVSDEAGARRLAETTEIWEFVEEHIEAQRLQEEAADAVREAERERYLAMDEGARSYERYTDAMADAVDETLNMNDRVQALKAALEELEGVTKTQEERDRELAGTQRNLNDFFEDNAEAISEMDQNLIDMSTGMPVHTDIGDQLATMLGRVGDDAHEAALEIYDLAEAEGWSTEKTQEAIAEAYEPYIATLQDLEDQGYLTGEEVDALTGSIIGVPEITSILITDNESIGQTETEVINLVSQIESIPEGEAHITDKESIEHLLGDLEDMEYEINDLDDGEVEIIAMGIPDAVGAIEDNLIDRDWSTTVNVKVNTLGGMMPDAPSFLPKELGGRRYHGGIDVKGMADGGVTSPASVMDVAQFVKPGDIRFAGDRSDVDEAWIPLDGSARSKTILDEAIARMPNYAPPVTAEGMASGGVTGVSGTVDLPQVEEVDAPDTEPLTATWQDAMDQLNESTITAFDDIESDTATSQEAMRAAVAAASGGMVDDTSSAQAAMQSTVTATNSTITADTDLAQRTMQKSTADAQTRMTNDTSTQLSNRTSDTAAQNAAMRSDTVDQMRSMREGSWNQIDVMRANTEIAMSNMKNAASYEIAMLRFNSGQEFTTMRTEGVSAATDLRTGIVSQMSQARTPFTGNVNDLVEVMQRFSKSLNDAYSDMGVKVGTPTSLWTGGILAGYSPGRDIHQFTSPTGGRLNLSGGEGIARPEVVRAMGSARFNQLNAAARRGGVAAVRESLGSLPVQSFADGGIFDAFGDDAKRIRDEFKPQLPDNWVKPVGSTVMDEVVDGLISEIEAFLGGSGWVRPTTGRITSSYGPRGGGWHAGMDIAAGHGTPVVAPTAGIVRKVGTNIGPGRTGVGYLLEHANKMFTYGGHNPVGGVRVKEGETVMPGQRVGAQGTTGNVTGAHLHWEVHRGSPWADVNPRPFWDAAGGGSGGVGSGGSDRWENVIKMALRLNGLPTNGRYVQPWMRQVQTESGGNPRAVQGIRDINSIMGNHARGLLQVIPPTFAAYSRPGMTDIFNPLHNAAAGIAYAKSRYGVTGMLNVIGKGRGYKNGTEYARAGWSMVGEQGPELVRFAGGEQVLNNRETMDAFKPQPMTRREAAMVGEEIASRMPEGGNVIIDKPQVRDDRDIKRLGTTFRREYRKLSRR